MKNWNRRIDIAINFTLISLSFSIIDKFPSFAYFFLTNYEIYLKWQKTLHIIHEDNRARDVCAQLIYFLLHRSTGPISELYLANINSLHCVRYERVQPITRYEKKLWILYAISRVQSQTFVCWLKIGEESFSSETTLNWPNAMKWNWPADEKLNFIKYKTSSLWVSFFFASTLLSKYER